MGQGVIGKWSRHNIMNLLAAFSKEAYCNPQMQELGNVQIVVYE